MKHKLIQMLVIFLFFFSSTALYAETDKPWRGLLKFNNVKQYKLISAELKDMSDNGMQKNDTLVCALQDESGLIYIKLMIHKTKNDVIKDLFLDNIYRDKLGVEKAQTWQINISNNKYDALYLKEQRRHAPMYINIRTIDPDFLPEIAKYYKEIEKIFFSKITDPKIKKFVKTLK